MLSEQDHAITLKHLGEMYADHFDVGDNAEWALGAFKASLKVVEVTQYKALKVELLYYKALLTRASDQTEARELFRRAAEDASFIDVLSTQTKAEVKITWIDFRTKKNNPNLFENLLVWCEEKLAYFDDMDSIRVHSDAYYLHGVQCLRHHGMNRALTFLKRSQERARLYVSKHQMRTTINEILKRRYSMISLLTSSVESKGGEAEGARAHLFQQIVNADADLLQTFMGERSQIYSVVSLGG